MSVKNLIIDFLYGILLSYTPLIVLVRLYLTVLTNFVHIEIRIDFLELVFELSYDVDKPYRHEYHYKFLEILMYLLILTIYQNRAVNGELVTR